MMPFDNPHLGKMADDWDDEGSIVELVNNAYRLGRGKWKRLEDEKPPEGKRYLAYHIGIGGSPGYIDVVHWFQPIGDFFDRSITHWMELPDFPSEGSP